MPPRHSRTTAPTKANGLRKILMKTTFLQVNDFSYVVRVNAIAVLPGHVNVQISTAWAQARCPDVERVVLSLTLRKEELQNLVTALQAGLVMPALNHSPAAANSSTPLHA